MFQLPELSYGYDALAPAIDATTMEIHHQRHHGGYVTKLNAALENTERAESSLEEILQSLPMLPESIRASVRNNGGGHRNHSFFWKSLSPTPTEPSEKFREKIEEKFGSRDEFREKFLDTATKLFGSGRARLVIDDDSFEIITTPNQDNPLMHSQTAVLGVDLREHAYYLNYQNRRPDYLAARRNLIDRARVSQLAGC